MLETMVPDSDVNSMDSQASLDGCLRQGALTLLNLFVKAEVQDYIDKHQNCRDAEGRRLVIKNGLAAERTVLTGQGALKVRAPRVLDRREGHKFTSKLLPPYLRKSPCLSSVLPVLYLKGLSANDFTTALQDLLGEGVKGLSKSTIHNLKKSWETELDAFHQEAITERFVYLWVDGVYLNVRLGDDKRLCVLVVMGVNEQGEKKLVGLQAGYRESKSSWTSLFQALCQRGLQPPLAIVGDGGLGLWACIREMECFKDTRELRCWVHKIVNVLDKMPKRVHVQAKAHLHEMMNAASEADALKAREVFGSHFKDKFPKAWECIVKDWDKLVGHFNYPAAHWSHIRTTNPIESTFATVKLRTKTTKGAGSPKMAEVMAFKLMKEAEKKWRRIKGYEEIPRLLQGSIYKDGKEVVDHPIQQAVG